MKCKWHIFKLRQAGQQEKLSSWYDLEKPETKNESQHRGGHKAHSY